VCRRRSSTISSPISTERTVRLADRANILRTFATKVVVALVGLAAGVIVARTLGPAGKGEYALILFISSMTVSLGTLNIGDSAIYFFNRRKIPFGSILLTNGAFIIGASVFFDLILLGLWKARALPWRELDAPGAMAFVCILVPLVFFQSHLLDLSRCIRRFDIYNGLLLAQPILYLVLVLTLVVYYGMGVKGAILATIGTYMLLVAWGAAGFFRRGRAEGLRFDGAFLRDSIAYGLKGHVGNMFHKLNLRLDLLFISPLWGTAMLGQYSVAVVISELLWYVPDAIGIVTQPRLAAGEEGEGARLTASSLRITGLLTLGLAAAAALVARPGVRLIYGAAFSPAVIPVYFLLPGVFCLGFSKILSKYFSGIGRPEINTATCFIGLIATVGLCIALIPSYGIVGAALASSIAYFVRMIFDLLIFLRISKMGFGGLISFKSGEISSLCGMLRKGTGTPS
jgi:O-antigen/teichoic acid export membrane protein